MFPYVCKQTFRKLFGYITREFLGLRMRNFQIIIFLWTRTYREIFKSREIFKQCYIAKPSVYCFYVKTKILVDFHISISVTLSIMSRKYCALSQNINWWMNWTTLCCNFMKHFARLDLFLSILWIRPKNSGWKVLHENPPKRL